MPISIPIHTSTEGRSLDQPGSGLTALNDHRALAAHRSDAAAQAAKVREKSAAVVASASGQVPGKIGR
jgi:hypothetical protein